MATASNSRVVLDGVALSAPVGGLLSVATMFPNVAPHAFHAGVHFEERLSAFLRDAPAAGQSKVFEAKGEVRDVDPFTLYQGLEMFIFEQDQIKDLVTSAFNRSESTSVERKFQTNVLNPLAMDITPTAGTAVTNARQALGMLEQSFGSSIAARPVIHTNRLGASLLRDLQVGSDYKLHTKQGSPVANGSGYGDTGPGGLVAGPGEAWVYVTSDVLLARSEIVTGEPVYDLPKNKVSYLVEATYIPITAGPIGAILLGAQ